MKTIDNEIKSGNLKNVYLLYGTEFYLLYQYRDKLLRAMNAEEDMMNFTRFEGKKFQVKELMEKAEELPFFSEYRVILVQDSGLFKQGGEQLAAYLKDPCSTTRFLFVEKEIDKRSGLYKQVQKIGHVVQFEEQKEEVLKIWIAKMAAREGKRITTGAVEQILLRTGTDMCNISSELEKLICYTYGREEIHTEDVEAIVSTRVQNHIFDMISAIGMKQQEQALSLYYELLALKEAPIKILSLLATQFNQLLMTKEMREKGYPKSTMAEKIKKPPFVIDIYGRQSRLFSMQELKNAIIDCADAEEKIKTGRMVDKIAVEIIIVKYSAKK